MLKYQDPSMYALIDLTTEEFEVVGRGLRELSSLYDQLGASDDDKRVIQSLITALERRWETE